MKALDNLNLKLLDMLLVAGGVSLLTMLGLTCYNIAMRPLHLSISGVYELMGYCGAIVITCGLAHAQMKKAHLRVDLVVNSYPKGIQSLVHFVNYSICILISGIAVWKVGVKGWTIYSTSEVSETLQWHYYPFIFGVAAGFVVLALLFVADLIGDLSGTGENKR